MIHDYQPLFYPGVRSVLSDRTGNTAFEIGIIIRSFFLNEKRVFLFINCDTLKSTIAPVEEVFFRNPLSLQEAFQPIDVAESTLKTPPVKHYFSWEKFRVTPYVDTLFRFTEVPATVRNNGLSHGIIDVKGFFLTVDMCPSVKPIEQAFFQKLCDLAAHRGSPFPVAICMTGVWMDKHTEDFQWLVDQQMAGRLEITWVNHSYSHFYLEDLVDEENFMLNFFTDLNLEFFSSEKSLIMSGQTPSPFIRFPGLVTDASLTNLARKFGLIPLGSDAWLAKGQEPTNGSVILVHGNGNEHKGIIDVMEILSSHDPKGWLALQDAVC